MKRSTVTIPTLPWPVISAMWWLCFVIDLFVHPHYLAQIITTAPMLWAGCSTYQRIFHKGADLPVPVGKAPPPPSLPPPPRLPKAFPPEPGQCFICGTYDHDREAVLGDAAHATCREWLGDWKTPNWQISYRTRQEEETFYTINGRPAYTHGLRHITIATLPGTTTRRQVIDHCHTHLGSYRNDSLRAELDLPDGTTTDFYIPAEPARNKPIDLAVVQAFYNNEGMTVTEFTETITGKPHPKEDA